MPRCRACRWTRQVRAPASTRWRRRWAPLSASISGAIFTALGRSDVSVRWLEGVITFEGCGDDVALREAAIVALGFNLLLVVVAIASIMRTIPPGKRAS
jgi:DHA2 family multidrug resistance protein-like MFS transporter